MQWFKHDTNANTDTKLIKLRMRYGLEGYGLYWFCLEAIASNVDAHNLTFQLEHDVEIIAHQTGLHYEKVQQIMTYMVEVGLFENDRGIITCLKMAKRLDSSMTSNQNMRKMIKNIKDSHDPIMTLVGGNHDPIMTPSGQDHDSIMQERKKERKKEGGFTPPTPSEVDSYLVEKGYKVGFDGEKFCDSYASQGWKKKGGQKVVDWKACVRTWVKTEKNHTDNELPYAAGGI
jgi:hypothetical protein